jgi:hypothetical protein
VALSLLVGIAFFTYYVEMLWKGGWDLWMVSSGCPAMTPVFALFLLTALTGTRALRRVGFTRRELLVVYSVLLVGAPVVTYEIIAWVLVKSIHYYYMAQVQPLWGATFLNEVPTWFAPSDPAAVEGFFSGQARVPWARWAEPLGAWSAFMVALFVASLCLMALLRRCWTTEERLAFPIAQLPLAMVRAPAAWESGRGGRFTLARAFWAGTAISFSLHLLSGLGERVPSVPTIPLNPTEIIPWQKVGPLAGLGSISITLWPWLMAIAYLIPKELSFSIWFFWLVRLSLHVAACLAGATPQRPEDWYSSSFPAPYYQGAGAVIALTGWVLWTARKHLGGAARAALGRGIAQQRGEARSLRWAFWGLVICCGLMVWFLRAAGGRVGFGAVLVVLMLCYFLIWARIRAETGLGMLIYPMQIHDLLMVPLGSRVFRVRELVTLMSMRWAYYPGLNTSFDVFGSTIMESYKIADSAQIRPGRLMGVITAGFVVSVIAGVLIVLPGIYHHGWWGFGFTRSGWLMTEGTRDGSQIVSFLSDARYAKTDWGGLLAVAAGAGTALVLGLLRIRFWWWPFHPIGYLAANTWGLQLWFLPFLVGWAAKALITRYGGLVLYRSTIPLAVGLILGDLLNSGLWGVLRLVRLGAY